MTDDALVAWLGAGGKPALSQEEEAARRHRAFSLRFAEALTPLKDLGPTCELHEIGIAHNVAAVHRELNALGEVEYSAVWALIPANYRRAIKAYVVMANEVM